jgi:hypothetical protein
MSASLSYSAHQAAIKPEQFWLEIDERLIEAGQPGVWGWDEELAHLYAAGLTVAEAARCVLARRRVRP